VRPYFNDDRPELVILSESAGMVFYEIVEWEPGEYQQVRRKVKVRNRWATYFDFKPTGVSDKEAIISPVARVDRFRKNLLLYVPRIGKKFRKRTNVSSIRTGLYFPNMTQDEARQLMGTNQYNCFVIGHNSLNPNDIRWSTPYLDRELLTKGDWEEEWLKDIRFWLIPPLHKLEEGIPIKLTNQQKRYAEPKEGMHQRLMGVAGSGKTLVLVQRAAKAASENKKVFIATYNITLLHYIKSQLHRAAYTFDWENITIKHFHKFCSNFLMENQISWPKHQDEETMFIEKVPKLVIDALESGKNAANRSYDSIYIDEGQDYYKLWYDCLCKFLSKKGEVFLAYDTKQDVYETMSQKDNIWSGTKMSKKVGNLKSCYRFPPKIVEKANEFSESFLPEVDTLPLEEAQYEFPFLNPRLYWCNIGQEENVVPYVSALVDDLVEKIKLHKEDIIILVPTHKEGWLLVNSLKHKYKINHIFEPEPSELGYKPKANKHAFTLDEPGLKMSTIHSFKGWELRSVIICTPPSGSGFFGQLHQIIYSSITRARENLMVINRHEDYVGYGKSWPSELL
jgi:hypothetical protein